MAAAELFNDQAGPTALDYGEIGLNIIYKFIDVLQAVAIIVVTLIVLRYVRRYFQKVELAHEAQRTALNLLEKLVSGFFAVIAVVLALKVVGLDLTLIISSVMLGLSFGLKDIIKNYISGILILFKSPFNIGDIVKIHSYIGKVERIEFQSTTLKTFDNREITIYNKDVLTQSIVNFSKELERRIELIVLLGHGTDLKQAMKVYMALLDAHPKVLKSPKYTVVFRRFIPAGAEIAIRFWVKRPCNILHIRSEIAAQIQSAFDETKVISPFERSVEFNADVGMTKPRQERLQLFYAQPELATATVEVENDTAGTSLSTTSGLVDEDEPEEF